MTYDWEAHRSTLESLHRKRLPYEAIRQYMVTHHDFKPKITAYKLKFSEWGWHRYGRGLSRATTTKRQGGRGRKKIAAPEPIVESDHHSPPQNITEAEKIQKRLYEVYADADMDKILLDLEAPNEEVCKDEISSGAEFNIHQWCTSITEYENDINQNLSDPSCDNKDSLCIWNQDRDSKSYASLDIGLIKVGTCGQHASDCLWRNRYQPPNLLCECCYEPKRILEKLVGSKSNNLKRLGAIRTSLEKLQYASLILKAIDLTLREFELRSYGFQYERPSESIENFDDLRSAYEEMLKRIKILLLKLEGLPTRQLLVLIHVMALLPQLSSIAPVFIAPNMKRMASTLKELVVNTRENWKSSIEHMRLDQTSGWCWDEVWNTLLADLTQLYIILHWDQSSRIIEWVAVKEIVGLTIFWQQWGNERLFQKAPVTMIYEVLEGGKLSPMNTFHNEVLGNLLWPEKSSCATDPKFAMATKLFGILLRKSGLHHRAHSLYHHFDVKVRSLSTYHYTKIIGQEHTIEAFVDYIAFLNEIGAIEAAYITIDTHIQILKRALEDDQLFPDDDSFTGISTMFTRYLEVCESRKTIRRDLEKYTDMLVTLCHSVCSIISQIKNWDKVEAFFIQMAKAYIWNGLDKSGYGLLMAYIANGENPWVKIPRAAFRCLLRENNRINIAISQKTLRPVSLEACEYILNRKLQISRLFPWDDGDLRCTSAWAFNERHLLYKNTIFAGVTWEHILDSKLTFMVLWDTLRNDVESRKQLDKDEARGRFYYDLEYQMAVLNTLVDIANQKKGYQSGLKILQWYLQGCGDVLQTTSLIESTIRDYALAYDLCISERGDSSIQPVIEAMKQLFLKLAEQFWFMRQYECCILILLNVWKTLDIDIFSLISEPHGRFRYAFEDFFIVDDNDWKKRDQCIRMLIAGLYLKQSNSGQHQSLRDSKEMSATIIKEHIRLIRLQGRLDTYKHFSRLGLKRRTRPDLSQYLSKGI